MPTIQFLSEGNLRDGYLALPQTPNGRAILVLHAWWGLTPFFQQLCDQLAAEGFVAFAPDLHHGKTANTIEAATQILEERDFPATKATALAALAFFQHDPAAQGKPLGALGFSMGAGFCLLLHELQPDAFSAVTMFYGGSEANLSNAGIPYLCHFAENDAWEAPIEEIQKMAAPNVSVYIYPGTKHWFFENDRPEYNEGAATLAWQRTLAFFKEKLS